MTRIVSGIAKGRTIQVPANGTRPTTAKIREALFSKLENWDLVSNKSVLDIFAGSGALGLEALSRGASTAVFVEQSRKAVQVVKDNVKNLDLQHQCVVVCQDASKWLASTVNSSNLNLFDLVFVDPPYAWSDTSLSQLLISLATILSDDGMLVVERSSRSDQPDLGDTLVLEDHRTWGDTTIWFIGKPTETFMNREVNV